MLSAFAVSYFENLHNIPKDDVFYSHFDSQRTLQRLVVILMIGVIDACSSGLVIKLPKERAAVH